MINISSAYNNVAVCYYNLGIKKNLRLKYFEEADKLDSQSIPIAYNLATEYEDRGKRCKAIELYEKMIKLEPEEMEYYHNIVELKLKIFNIKNTPKELKEKYLEEATNMLKQLFKHEKMSEEFKTKYPEEAYLVYCIEKLEQLNDEPKIYFYLSRIFQNIKNIKDKLIVNFENNLEIAHYTNLNSLKELIKDGAKLRISNAAYLNDPTEGLAFEECLKSIWEKDIYKKYINLDCSFNEDNQEIKYNNTYIASFSAQTDYLPMWVQYGDDAQGCSLVLNKEIFDKSEIEKIKAEISKIRKSEGVVEKKSYCLYNVNYISPDGSDLNDSIKKEISEIGKVLHECMIALEDINDRDVVFDFARTMIEQVRYLFKTSAYKHEKEMRIIIFSEIENTKTEEFIREGDLFPRVFVELEKELKFDKIIFGSKVSKVVEKVPYLMKSGKIKKVYKSTIKYK
jgi:hypothetical protein